MRYILVLSIITVLGCTPAANLDQASIMKNEKSCAKLTASYERAKNRKAELETKTEEKQDIDIAEAFFSWPSILAKRIEETLNANEASKKMRELKKEMGKQNCRDIGKLNQPEPATV